MTMSGERVPEAELEVLALLERGGPTTARRVREGIAAWRPLGHSSVVTLLNRLEERGLVERTDEREGKAFIYRAVARREATAQPLLRRLVQRVFGGNPLALVASLFETRPPTERELEELERMVEELKARRARRRS